MTEIDIVIPVYRGIDETRACLESVLRTSSADLSDIPHELIVVDDCGPEPELAAYLDRLAERGQITLLRNEQNLGFVASVNRGMTLHSGRDVVLLNSDTQVHGNWLKRLRDCAYRNPNVGTVTPFSNNATICSYPDQCHGRPMPDGWDLAGLDRIFAHVHRGKSIEIPTAIGFCMYIRRTCLDEVGLFDVERFGKGYGEENDFCMRAARRGWRHELCADTFVYHVGTVSFGAAQKQLAESAINTIRKLYPRYEQQVENHVLADPARPLRLAVDVERLRTSNRPTLLFVVHALGGGTHKHIDELSRAMQDIDGGANVLLLSPGQHHDLVLSWLAKNETFRLFFRMPEQFKFLVQCLRNVNLDRLHFHHTFGIAEQVWQLPQELGVPYDYTLHDYFSICPNTTLVDHTLRYCGEPDEEGCNACLARTKTTPVDIRAWRAAHGELVEGAQRVMAPSLAVAQPVQRHFPAARILVAPHPEPNPDELRRPPRARNLTAEEPLRIVSLGAFSEQKGADLLEAAAVDARRRGLPLEFHLVGYAYRDLEVNPASALCVRGPYKNETLPDLLNDIEPHLAWFPQLGPETYCYTLSEVLRLGLPVASTDLGAVPDRLAGRNWSWVYDWRTTPAEWNDAFLRIRNWHFSSQTPPAVCDGTAERSLTVDQTIGDLQPSPRSTAAAPLPSFDYARDYLRVVPRRVTQDTAAADEIAADEAVDLELIIQACLAPHKDIERRLRQAVFRSLNRLRSGWLLKPLAKALPRRLKTRVRHLIMGDPAEAA